ncbi:RHS repeat-associated core domain-containing protein [Hyalangium versicolor]|uniref:RHS repeat-associated core domain-containing protein n=1 Tax=Hyalangium versicolor TaxID=2861190 RepID=UPI001CCC2001|nr:RHS repeat-associated core domain-containing protein [Hyalangium versicolor]
MSLLRHVSGISWLRSLASVLFGLGLLTAPLLQAQAQVCSLPSPESSGDSPPGACSSTGSISFCQDGKIVSCTCGGESFCSKCCAANQSCSAQAIGIDAPAGFYQCCYSTGTCSPSQGTAMIKANACPNDPNFPCTVGQNGVGSSCSNGPGACSVGTCGYKSANPTASLPSGGGICSPDIGTQCNAPKPLENPETCDNLIDDNCDGQVDEDCPFAEPDGGTPVSCKGENCQCNPLMAGDPVNTALGNSFERIVDVDVPGTIGSLQFTRRHTSNPVEWVHDAALLNTPKPFGASLTQPDGVEWWHEYLSFVAVSSSRWSVRDRDGRLLRFYPCTGTPCQTEPGYGNKSVRERLVRTSTGFTLVTMEGERLIFEAPYASSSAGVDHYFLSRILSSEGRTLATLTYQQPSNLSCPTGASGTSSGVPYLAEVASPEARLSFDYRALAYANTQVECVIGGVSLQPTSSDGGSAVPIVTYAYTLDGSTERPGRLASATWSDRSETYEYTGGAYQQSGSNGTAVRHEYGANGTVALAQGGDEAWQFDSVVSVGTCQSGSNCCGRLPTIRKGRNLLAGKGDGTAADAGFTRAFETLPNFGQQLEPRFYQLTDSCGLNNFACSPGTVRHEWTCTTPTSPGYEQAVKDKRGNWEVYEYAQDGGVPTTPLERIAVKRGATDKNGTGALETKRYEYTYGPNGEQLLAAEKQDTLLGPSGQYARTDSIYEPGTTRMKAIIQSGWTRIRDDISGTWSSERRFIGTFFFTSRIASGESTPDPLGRTLEVHGPCFVSGVSATDCASSQYPLTQYHYWPDTESSSRRNRLKSISRYASPISTPNVVTFTQYDAWGNVTESVDDNGVTTQSTYQDQRLISQSVGSQPATQYGYDQGRLIWTRFPEGNYEVFCYRKDTPGAACTGGTLTDKLQWKAKASSSDGATWTEKVTYTSWPDGTVQDERYLSWGASGAEARRVVKYAADAHGRPTWQQRGEKPSGVTWNNASIRLFDGADNLIGEGNPFNDPPVFCNGPNASGVPASTVCNSLVYDKANRLTQLDEFTTTAQRTCMSYDVQGNVTSVKVGCTTSTACSSCTQPAAQYTYDDFGRVVEVQLPHAEGPIRYAYDASGNTRLKETEQMRRNGEYLAYTYDGLSRLLSATRVYTLPSAGQQTLYRFGYDQDEAPDASCPQPSNTRGHMRYRVDSFGRTWFQYDSRGRLTGEIRVRAGTTTCNGSLENNPHTLYAYTDNGNLSQITYPHGRVVTYVYGPGAAKDRVDSIDVTLHNGTAWGTSQRILSHAAWEPYAGLRGYQLHHLGSSNLSAVEYALGDNAAAVPSAFCSSTGPSAASSDLSGRVRSLRVSTGAFTPGTYPGDIYQRTYRWRADQVATDHTCVLGGTSPRTETFNYDKALRLTSADFTPNATGTPVEARTYDYDGRSNRKDTYYDNTSLHTHTYGAAPLVDRLLSRNSTTQTGLVEAFSYDADGRVTEKRLNKLDSETVVRPWLSFSYGPDDTVATDSVFKAIVLNGTSYNYFYDALGRRRLKVYPSGVMDEFFYDSGHQLLTDQGVNTPLSPIGFRVEDDYIWLDGRPVSIIRGRLSTSWSRESDASTDCARNGEAALCGVYFPVTDHIGKPVVMLDSSRKVAGLGEYDPFGHVNRLTLEKGTAHPYASNLTNQSIASYTQPVGAPLYPNMSIRTRVLFGMVDTEDNAGTPVDYVRLKTGTTFLTNPLGGQLSGPVWTPWVQPPTGSISVEFTSNATTQYYGVVMKAYEHQRYQTGAQPFWTPLRFPGQYHDSESDLFENWNRFYDPSIGRYLQPEPMLQTPGHMQGLTMRSSNLASYAYAQNNPVYYTDATGLNPLSNAIPLVRWLLPDLPAIPTTPLEALFLASDLADSTPDGTCGQYAERCFDLPTASFEADICEMAKGGRGNRKATWIPGALQEFMSNNKIPDECEALRRMIEESRAAKDFQEAQELKAYGKAIGCIWSSLKK